MRRILLALALALALPFATLAQTVTNQGQGNRMAEDWVVNQSARFVGKTTEVAVTNAAGGSAVPATALFKRKAIEIQNNGPNPIYCTVDGSLPVALSNGRWIAASGGIWSIDAGPGIAVKCIAGTAAQVSGAATMVTELR